MMAAKYPDNHDNQHNQRFSDLDQESCKMLMPIQGYENQPLVSLEQAVEPIVSLVPDVKRMAYVAKRKCKKNPANHLSMDESASIILYSMEWEPQEQSLYHVLNKTLRTENRKKLKPWFLYLKLILTALSRLPPSHRFVFRGIRRDLRKDYPEGETIYWWGFSSCTTKASVLQNEDYLGTTGKRTIFTIECFSGKDIREHSNFEHEAEILLLPGRQFEVVSCLNQGNNLYLIQLKEVEPAFPLLGPISQNTHEISIPASATTKSTVKPSNRMILSSNQIERKAVDISGRLGSLYDASHDRFLNNCTVKSFADPAFNPNSECRILPGSESNGVLNLLKAIKFDDALLQSILLGLVQPSGISSFINYDQPINENTCFLYYSYRHKEEKLDIVAGEADKIVSLPSDLNNATHMVTKITWGFEILCVIQNSNKGSGNSREELLYNISEQLQQCDKSLELTDQEKLQLTELSNVTVFGSEKSVDTSNTSLRTVLDRIRGWQRHTSYHVPIIYTLHPLKWLYKNQRFPDLFRLSDQDNLYIAQIEPTIIHLDDYFNNLKQIFKNLPKNRTTANVDGWLKDIPEQFVVLSGIYEDFQTKLRNMLVDVRQGNLKSIEINNIIFDKRYSLLRKPAIDEFYSEVQQWLAKVKLIERLNSDNITYVSGYYILRHHSVYMTIPDIDKILENYFSQQQRSATLWYSSDRLKQEKTDEWEKIYHQLTLEQQKKGIQQTSLFYIDFTQCNQKLEEFNVKFLSIQPPSQSRQHHPRVHPLPSVPQEQLPATSSPTRQRPSKSINEINVLMLSETGVGKSTFINAFVNYLIFDTLQQAKQSEPVVLIPVSFLTTISDQFDEFIVKFGDVDANEDHEHQGQSVTQQCKSYVFHLNDRLILRLIDTPGIGDTRGVAQDDKTMDHILTYVNNLSHLNAVCFLLKPNTSQLNVFFRSCVNQLFTYLTPAGYNNIIFCFTNARATFFTPGDTGPLLRQMLKKEHRDDIPFQKTNTFCFDNESFRYLAARKCGVEFDDFQKQECINSWTTSVTESVRLFNYILTRTPYDLDKSQSSRKVSLDISLLARPLMETLRLILYNWQLSEVGSPDKQMILNSNPVIFEMCSHCARNNIVERRPFWIVEYEPVKNNTVQQCQCPFDERHFLIESTVQHDFASQRIDLSDKELENQFHDFLLKCDTLTYYLQQKYGSNQNDPFAPVLEQFLAEEQQISDKMKINLNLNKKITETLRSIKKTRRLNMQQLMQSNEKLSVEDVYEIIEQLKTIRAVTQQLKSIQTSRQLKMTANEHEVKLPPLENKRFSELINSFH